VSGDRCVPICSVEMHYHEELYATFKLFSGSVGTVLSRVAQNAVLVVKNLHKEYHRSGRPRCFGLSHSGSSSNSGGSSKVVIADSSFALSAGEIFGLLGPNGAGKSTTLNIVIAETHPTSGQVRIILKSSKYL